MLSEPLKLITKSIYGKWAEIYNNNFGKPYKKGGIDARIRVLMPPFIKVLPNVYKVTKVAILPFINILAIKFFPAQTVPLIALSLSAIPKKPKKRAVILVRVSTKKQARGSSIKSQLDTLREFAKKEEYHVVRELVEDGKSGKKIERDAIWEIIQMALAGEFEYLLVTEIDRVGRDDPISQITFLGVLFQLGVTVVTPDRTYNLNDFPTLITTVAEAKTARDEIKNIARRVIRTKKTRFKDRIWVTNVKFGYVKEGKWIKKSKEPKISEVIPEIFRIFRKKRSYAEVSREIERKFKMSLSVGKIRRILTDSVYCGRPRYSDVEVVDKSLAYIDEKLFRDVQKIIERRKKGKQRVYLHRRSLEFAKKLLFALGMSNVSILVPEIAYVCPKCRVKLNCNGPKQGVQYYVCPKCGHKYPDFIHKRRNLFRNAIHFVCLCGAMEDVDIKKIRKDLYEYRCRSCGLRYVTNLPENIYKRYFTWHWLKKQGKKPFLKVIDDKQTEIDSF